METMSPAEVRNFLLSAPRTGSLATVRPDGRPHVVPIWFDLDGDDLLFTTWHTTVKAANLRRDLRLAICVDDPTPPFAFVLIEGTAEFSDNLEELKEWATRIAGRYMGQDLAEAFGKRNAVEGELLVRVKPIKVVAQKRISD
jgi:PPOX class probable F420-dependent enzyme